MRNVLIETVIVFLFTSALFLSGYVLQQQTVRDLRAAIKPKPTPEAARMYLPKQFMVQPTPSPNAGMAGVNTETQASDGSEIMVEAKNLSNDIPQEGDGHMDPSVVEGRRTRRPAQYDLGSAQDQKPMALADDLPDVLEEKPLSRAERRKKIKEEILAAGEGEGFKGYKRRQW